jgi:tetratricopeptide (TPR) repeat protein
MTKKKGTRKKKALRIPAKKLKAPSYKKKKQKQSLQPERPPSRLRVERLNRAITQIMKKHDFKDIDEMNRFYEKHFLGKKLDDILKEREYDPIEEAQDLAYEAMDTDDPIEALRYTLEALLLDPNCIDALMLAAEATASTDWDLIKKLKMIIARAEEAMGRKYIEENRGHFWGVIETRPYMRARAALAETLHKVGQREEAICQYEEMLELNPHDNQGLRYNLLSLYLEKEDLTGVRRIFKEYGDEPSAFFLWGRVLERYLSGKRGEAGEAALKAKKQNPHVIDYLTGKKRPPKEPIHFYSPGKESEAIACFDMMNNAWKKYPEAIKWLKSLM